MILKYKTPKASLLASSDKHLIELALSLVNCDRQVETLP